MKVGESCDCDENGFDIGRISRGTSIGDKVTKTQLL